MITVNVKKPNRGFFRIDVKPGEMLVFSNGKARRCPPDKDSVFNSIPIKYITSIRVEKCGCCKCGKYTAQLVCVPCLQKMADKIDKGGKAHETV